MRRAAAVLAFAALAACTQEQTVRDRCDEGLCPPGTLTFGARATSLVASRIEAVAITPDDPPWFAGTYDGDVTVDNLTLYWDSNGYRDPFLARTGVRDLATVIADDAAGYPQRVVGIVPDAEDGATVFTIGQQEDTRHRLEAAWFDRHGRFVVRQTIALLDAAGAGGGASVAIDARGWPVVAVSGTRIDLGGEIFDGARAKVVRLGQGFRRDPVVDLTDVDIADLDIDGDVLAIGGTYTGAPGVPPGSVPWPACPDAGPCGFIAALDAGTGVVRWVQRIHAIDGAEVHDVGVGGDIVGAIASTRGMAIDPPLVDAASAAYLVTLLAAGADGQPALLDQTVLVDDPTTDVGSRELDVASDGALVVGLAYQGRAWIGSLAIDTNLAPGTYASLVGELGTDQIWRWHGLLRAELARIEAIAVDGDQLVVGGSFRGAVSYADTQDPALPPASEVENGFVLELHR